MAAALVSLRLDPECAGAQRGEQGEKRRERIWATSARIVGVRNRQRKSEEEEGGEEKWEKRKKREKGEKEENHEREKNKRNIGKLERIVEEK